jgi:FlaA1/EpsC-like NDP-sugar epimerase
LVTSLVNRLRILPRWVIIAIDASILLFSTFLGFCLRFNFNFKDALRFNLPEGLILFSVVGVISSLITKSYAGVVRYTGIGDGIRIMYTSMMTVGTVCFLNLIYYYNFDRNLIPYSVAVISFFVSFLFLFYYRLFVKSLFQFYKSEQNRFINLAIFGAGQLGITTKQAIEHDSDSKFKIIAFIEDDVNKNGKVINGTPVYAGSDLSKLIRKIGIKEIIIAVRSMSPERKSEILDIAYEHQVKVRYVPAVERWVKGELRMGQIREFNIEELLGREVIQLDHENIVAELAGERILVTGAGGSIGSELARQVCAYAPSQLVLLDQAESALHEIHRELTASHPKISIDVYVCDILNKPRLGMILTETQPGVIFHAAAYKHVPLMENHPTEAVTCNIFGTRNLADLAVKHHVKKFVMISTDKAVRPTSIMGCSKRIAEIYVQSLMGSVANSSSTSFVTTRFGNVLGSNGSVIPLFRKQIESGGPVTVTHPDIVRYFMTIPEACSLVLEAAVMGKGGEIFIFDMGKPVRIIDLAKQMVRLSGLELGKDIEIVFTGLREGEKLFEELLNDFENSVPTHHDKILKAKVPEYEYDQICSYLDVLEDLVKDRNELKVVAMMKDIVPEYKSNYSRFEVLDQ